ncbi:MAG: hypothetical protein Q8L55_05615, partial [Phycisphaerales bacterium]|nr:hypothetical protein [Phycisphaerales bacterium]
RIAVIGPGNTACAGAEFGLPEMSGIAAVGAGLGKHWPGASVHATVDQDACGKTVQRLMELENGIGPASAPAAAVDPRLSLTELSGRPGAADRKLHRWAGLALVVAAGAVAVIGWRIGKSIGEVQAQAEALTNDQTELLKSVASVAPTALKDEAPSLLLKSKRIEMERARTDQKNEEPILAEAQRVLLVLATVPDVRLKTLQINSLGILSRFELSVPLEGDQGPTVKDKLAEIHLGSKREVKWDGKHIRTGNTDRRDWNMAGQFVDVNAPATKPEALTGPGNDAAPPASPMLDTGPGAAPSPTEPQEPAPAEPAGAPATAPDPKPDPAPAQRPEPTPSTQPPETPPAPPSSPPPQEPKKEART